MLIGLPKVVLPKSLTKAIKLIATRRNNNSFHHKFLNRQIIQSLFQWRGLTLTSTTWMTTLKRTTISIQISLVGQHQSELLARRNMMT
jgi:hypothetical protein